MSTIITIEQLQTYSGDEVLEPTRAQLVVDAVNEYVQSVTGRSWGESQTATEDHDYSPTIFLRHQDVTAITSIEQGQGNGTRTVLDADDYYWNALGRVVLSNGRGGFSPSRDYVHVEYTYGTEIVPADLVLAALSLASDFYAFASDGGSEVSSEGIGSYRQTYVSGENSASGRAHFGTLTRYRTTNL